MRASPTPKTAVRSSCASTTAGPIRMAGSSTCRSAPPKCSTTRIPARPRCKVEYVGRAPLDGEDDQYLMASYRPGNRAPDPSDGLPTGVMIAMNGPTPSASVGSARQGVSRRAGRRGRRRRRWAISTCRPSVRSRRSVRLARRHAAAPAGSGLAVLRREHAAGFGRGIRRAHAPTKSSSPGSA